MALNGVFNNPFTDDNVGNNPDKKEIIPDAFPKDVGDADKVLGKISSDKLSKILERLKALGQQVKQAKSISSSSEFESLVLVPLLYTKNRQFIKDAIEAALKEYENEKLEGEKKCKIKDIKARLVNDKLYNNCDEDNVLNKKHNIISDAEIAEAVENDYKTDPNNSTKVPGKTDLNNIVKNLTDEKLKQLTKDIVNIFTNLDKPIILAGTTNVLNIKAELEKKHNITKDNIPDILGELSGDTGKEILKKLAIEDAPNNKPHNEKSIVDTLLKLKKDLEKKRKDEVIIDNVGTLNEKTLTKEEEGELKERHKVIEKVDPNEDADKDGNKKKKSESKKTEKLDDPEDGKNPKDELEFFELGAFHTKVVEEKRVKDPKLDSETVVSLAYCRDDIRGSMPGDFVAKGNKVTGIIYPKLVVDLVECHHQLQKAPQRKIGVFTLGESHGVSYGEKIDSDKMKGFPENVRDGYAIQKDLSKKIDENIEDIIKKTGVKAGSSNAKDIKHLLSSTEYSISRALTSTIPIRFINDGQGGKKACYSIGVQRNKVSDELRKNGISQVSVVFTGEPDKNDPNIQFLHIPGTGGDSDSAGENNRDSAKGGGRSLKLKVEMVSKDNTWIDGKCYQKGDIVIHENPFIQLGNGEFKELKSQVGIFGSVDLEHYTRVEKDLMKKMQVTATRQIGVATEVGGGEFRESMVIKQMAFFNKGDISRTGDLEIEVGINESKVKYQTDLSETDSTKKFTTTLNQKETKLQFEAPNLKNPKDMGSKDTKFQIDDIKKIREKILKHNEIIRKQEEEGAYKIKLSEMIDQKGLLDEKLKDAIISVFKDKSGNVMIDISDQKLDDPSLKNKLEILSQGLKDNKCKLVGLKMGDKIALADISKINENNKTEKGKTPSTPTQTPMQFVTPLYLEELKESEVDELSEAIKTGQFKAIKISKIATKVTARAAGNKAIESLACSIVTLEDKGQYCKVSIENEVQRKLLYEKLDKLRNQSTEKLFALDIKDNESLEKKNDNTIVKPQTNISISKVSPLKIENEVKTK